LNNTAGSANDSDAYRLNYQKNNVNFVNNSEIHLKLNEINEFDTKFGVDLDLETAFSDGTNNEAFNVDKAYIFGESKFGKFEIGNNIGANQAMKVGAANLARGAGGINGKYLEYINLPILANSNQGVNQIGNCAGFTVSGSNVTPVGSNCANIKLPKFILIPQSPISHGGYAQGFYNKVDDNDYSSTSQFSSNQSSDGSFGTLESATKISYYSPKISGLQIGASFTPNTGNSGGSEYFSGNVNNDVKDVVSWGLNYANDFDNIGFVMSFTGENGKIEQNAIDNLSRHDLNSYDIGLMASYFGFTIGASYGNWGNSLTPKSGIYSCQYNPNVTIAAQNCNLSSDRPFDSAKYYSAGLAYKIGPVAFSTTHLASEFQNNEYVATSIGLDYKISKGLMPYLELTKFNFESDELQASDVSNQTNEATKQIRDNKGYVMLAGLLFSF